MALTSRRLRALRCSHFDSHTTAATPTRKPICGDQPVGMAHMDPRTEVVLIIATLAVVAPAAAWLSAKRREAEAAEQSYG
jgi:hypothetical protein